ncbi:MAG: hypothetical protein DWH78_09610 [Planctomycetota bacterium]|nr:MAG: hypothetical protein DWH78_09610 [Planctomycetota bacterium]
MIHVLNLMDLPKIRVLQTRKTEEKDRRIAGVIHRQSSHGAEPTGTASIEHTVLLGDSKQSRSVRAC